MHKCQVTKLDSGGVEVIGVEVEAKGVAGGGVAVAEDNLGKVEESGMKSTCACPPSSISRRTSPLRFASTAIPFASFTL